MLADALASIGIIGVLVVLFVAATSQFASARRESDTRRILRLAAESELNRLRAGLRPAPTTIVRPRGATAEDGVSASGPDRTARGAEDVRRDRDATRDPDAAPESRIVVTVRESAGEGPWAGLRRVTVTATKLFHVKRRISVELSGYLPPTDVAR